MIPDELTARAQWIVWRSEQRRGRVTKVPYVPGTHRHARSNDPSTWRTFEEAMVSHRRDGFDGVGYAFSADDGLTGIDLDHCAGEYGVLDPWALCIVRELDSYAEWSPSGHGVHIIVQAQLPPRGRKRGDVEMYDRLRFFATTGNWLSITPPTVEKRQAALDGLHARVFPPPAPKRVNARVSASTPDDVTLIRRAQSARNGFKFGALWAGDTSLYAGEATPDAARVTSPCAECWAIGPAATPTAWIGSFGNQGCIAPSGTGVTMPTVAPMDRRPSKKQFARTEGG
ncbi:MAG: hypothetical protein GY851_24620 [bacterium]|nr:hypothetical protein [bacterium]